MTPPLRLGVVYDFRRRPDSDFSTPELYAEVLEQVAFLDRLGYDQVWLTEHHFVEDGYLPSFVPVAGAIAARTERIRISTDIALLPFHNPIRLAEDLAVLDNLSGGRIELGAGMGYIDEEFRAFGIPRPQRVSRTEEAIEVLRQAWSDEPVNFAGKRYTFSGVQVYPKPVQEGGIPLWMAAQSEAGARRAARFGTHFLPQGPRPEVLDPWRQAVRDAGDDPGRYRVGIIRPWLVTDDPERDWPPVKAGEVYRAKLYREWIAASGDDASGWQHADRIPQTWIVGDPAHCVDEISRFIETYGITDIVTWVGSPGIRPSAMNESLERFANEVMPALRARQAG